MGRVSVGWMCGECRGWKGSYDGGVDRSVVVFFFFQAEDGIRDWSVTGVQTCALPISDHAPMVARFSLGAWSAVDKEEQPLAHDPHLHSQIGRASCRERV